MSEEEYDFEDMSQDSDDPQWSSLTTEQKKELMVEVFDDDEWYSGTPHIGGTSLPEFGEIASRLSAPKSDIMKYYAAWVKTKGLNPQVMSRGKTMEPAPPTGAQPPAQQEQPMMPPPKVSPSGAGVAGQMKGALMNDMLGSMFSGGQQSGGGNDMKYMMGMMMMSNMLNQKDGNTKHKCKFNVSSLPHPKTIQSGKSNNSVKT